MDCSFVEWRFWICGVGGLGNGVEVFGVEFRGVVSWSGGLGNGVEVFGVKVCGL